MRVWHVKGLKLVLRYRGGDPLRRCLGDGPAEGAEVGVQEGAQALLHCLYVNDPRQSACVKPLFTCMVFTNGEQFRIAQPLKRKAC